MKKFLMALMAVLFLGATSMVLADGTAPAPKTTTTKSHKGGKGHKGGKKGKKAATTAPATTQPAAK